MANEGVLKGHGLVVPHFDGLIKWSWDDDGGFNVLVESNARDPISMSVLLNSEFALSNSVPDLKVSVNTTTGDLSVVWGESNSKYVSWVTNESLNGLSLSEVPKSEGSVPWTSQGISAVLWEGQIADKVTVSYGKNDY